MKVSSPFFRAKNSIFLVIDSRRRRNKERLAGGDPSHPENFVDASGISLFTESSKSARNTSARPRLDRAQLIALENEKETEVTRGYNRVLDLWENMLQGQEEADTEWMIEAERLVETFRETRNLFSSSKASVTRPVAVYTDAVAEFQRHVPETEEDQ